MFKPAFHYSIQAAVCSKSLKTTFTAKSAFLVASEWTRRVEFVVGVGPDDAGAQFVHRLENLAALVRPDARAQAVRDVVRAFDGLLRCAKQHPLRPERGRLDGQGQ